MTTTSGVQPLLAGIETVTHRQQQVPTFANCRIYAASADPPVNGLRVVFVRFGFETESNASFTMFALYGVTK